MRSFVEKKILIVLTACFVLTAISVLPNFAQTKKKSTRKPVSTKPTPVAQKPTVITQAEQYTNQNQQIITGNTEINPQTDNPNQPQPVKTPQTVDEKLDQISLRLGEMNNRINSMETNRRNDADEKQKRLMLNLEILTRAEQRSETLRKQLFEMIEKENSIKIRLEQILYDIRPEMIERQVAIAGTLRPEELREMRKKNLEVEKRNLETLLTDIQATRANLEVNVQKADQLVEKLRAKLEKEIDDALVDENKQ